MKEKSEKQKQKNKLFVFLIILLVSILLSVFVFPRLSSERLEAIFKDIGSRAGLLYILLFATLPGFFLPVIILIFPAGIVFGFTWGSIYTLIGASINMAWMFLLSRYLARESIQSLVKRKLKAKWVSMIEKNSQGRPGFVFLFLLRVTPLVPYNLINYVYGLSDMDFKNYIVSSILGIIPGTLVYLNIGDKILNPRSPEFVFSLILLAGLAVISTAIANKYFPEADEAGKVREIDKTSSEEAAHD